MFDSMIESIPKCTLIYAASVKSRHFQYKNIGMIRAYMASLCGCKIVRILNSCFKLVKPPRSIAPIDL